LDKTKQTIPFVGEEGEEDVEDLGKEQGGDGGAFNELQATIDYATIERLLT
jgi:hypothetical protein